MRLLQFTEQYYHQMSKRVERHSLSLGLTIKEAFIRTKLPGRVSFQIRGNAESATIRNTLYQLQNQHCAVYEHVLLPLQAQFDLATQNYRPLQVTIFVNVDSEHGYSVGGYVRFNPLEQKGGEKEWRLPLENLEPNSTLHFSSSLQLTHNSGPPFSKQVISAEPLSSIRPKKSEGDYNRSSAANCLSQNEAKNETKSYFKHVKQPYHTGKYLPKQRPTHKTKQVQAITSDRKYQRQATKIASPRQPETANNSKFNAQLETLKKKIDEQRVEKARSISKLKMEINPRLGSNEADSRDEEKSVLRERIRNLERKEKNHLINIDDLNAQIEKVNSKLSQASKSKEDLEKALAQKDTQLRGSASTIHTLNEHIQHLNSQQRVLHKKGELKENMLKTEANRMQEKIKNLQQDLNHAIRQKNQMLTTMGELQKKHQVASRDKDHHFNEEKTKILKQKEEWVKAQKQMQLIIEEVKEKHEILQKEANNKTAKILELQTLILKFQNQSGEFKQIIRIQKCEKDKMEQESQNFQQIELSNLKRQKNEIDSQNNVLKQKLKRIQREKKDLEARIAEVEENNKAKGSEHQKNLLKINALQKDLFSQKEETSRRARQVQYLKQTIANLNSKINHFKDKTEFEKSKRQQSSADLQKHLVFLSKQKEALDIQISDLKWSVIRENDKRTQLQQKKQQLDGQILKLNEELMTKTQRIITIQEKLKTLEVQNQSLSKQKQLSQLKAKQLIQINKIKQYEVQELTKSRLKAEYNYEVQKARAAQLEMLGKARENQEDKRQKERENQLRQAIKQVQALQTELFKKNEEISNLKNSFLLVSREMEYAKTESSNIQSQLTLLRSENILLKDQTEAMTGKAQSLANQLLLNSQNLIIEGKKIKSLAEQYRDYREGVRTSFEHLVKEFFKEQGNSNIIATSLLPFPDEALSSIQIRLVQQRNNFIVKHRQRLLDLQGQIYGLEGQISQQKACFQRKEEEQRKEASKETQRLKSFIYQTMVQKGNSAEELKIRTSEKEELLRQFERLRGQLIKKEDSQNQLNGQLQMLLLEYEHLKSQSQEMDNLVYRYREEQIKRQGQFEEKIMNLSQENSKLLQKLKAQNLQKEKKIIDLQRQRMDLGERQKRKQAQQNKCQQQHQKDLQKAKQQDYLIAKLASQSTKLHNTIRQNQLKEIRHKQTNQHQQTQIAQAKHRMELLQNQIANLHGELNSQNVLSQKLKADLQNLAQRLDQTHKLLYEKGEVSKQKIQKKMQENGQLKTKLIDKQSELSLKQFSLKQNQQQILRLVEENNQNKLAIQNLRHKIKQLAQQKQSAQATIRQFNQQLQNLQSQKNKTEEMLAKSNFNLYSLEAYAHNLSQIQQQFRQKEKECIQLRICNAQMQQHYDFELKSHKQTVSEIRKELQKERYHQNNLKLQHKASLQFAERNNAQKYNSLLFEFEKEKVQFEKSVEQIEVHNIKVIRELQSRLQNASQHLQELRYNQKLLQQQLARKDNSSDSLKKRLQTLELLNQELKQKYNKFFLLYGEAKTDKQQILKQNEQKLLTVAKQTKKSLDQNFKVKLSEINRKIQKLKHYEQIDLQAEPLTRKQTNARLQRMFAKIEELIEQGKIIQASDSFEVKKQPAHICS